MRPTEPFRREHEQLLEHIEHIAQAARGVPRLSDEERAALRERILGFLRGTLIPHAQAEEEEQVLYPEWSHRRPSGAAVRPTRPDQRPLPQGGGPELPAFDAAPPEITEAVLRRMEGAVGHTHDYSH